MRILVVNALFPPDRTGSSIFSRQLSDEFVQQGHEVVVVTASTNAGDESATFNYQVVRLPNRKISVGRFAWNYSIPISMSPANYRRMVDLVRTFRPDVVLSHGQIFDLTWLASLVARRRKTAHVVVIHTAIWHEDLVRKWILRLFERIVISPLIRLSRPNFIAVDKWTYNDARRRIAGSRQVSVIPISVDAQHVVAGDPQIARSQYGLGSSPVLLSLGHVVALRNRIALVESLPDVLRDHPDVKVVIVGDLRETHFLERAEELGVSHALVCVGSVPHSMMKHLLACATVEAHDLQGLGLGITTVEAMCASVPIVAVATDDNYPGISLKSYEGIHFLQDNRPSLIAKAIITLLNDFGARKRAVDAQHKLVAELFTPDSTAQKYVQALQLAVEGKTRNSI